MRISLVINAPSPETTEEIRDAVAKLREAGHAVWPQLTFEKGDGRRFAREAAAKGAELVIAAGGDGTINEVGNGIHDHLADRALQGLPSSPGDAPRLGVVPLGTGNDLAGALDVPTDVQAAIATAVLGKATPVDVGLLNGEGFLNVSTGGIGAEATEETSEEVKRLLGPVAYFITGMRKFVSLEVSSARFRGSETLYEGPFLIFAVGNSRRTGGGNWLTPRADMSDGLLDVCIVKEVPRRELLALLPELRTGRHLDHQAVIYRQVPALTVESTEVMSVNVDGEPMDARVLHYAVSPHRICLSLP
ncbi:MAG TPA: YegS/Rv2252/BmrU family lipid kinase [Longimicrobiaceae bacterium]|nr:YegS/Rv2252/BmrU family lipid kinase [Longimicrobiaceae bacterium]